MTSASAQEGEGGSINAANLRTNRIDFVGREGGGGGQNFTKYVDAIYGSLQRRQGGGGGGGQLLIPLTTSPPSRAATRHRSSSILCDNIRRGTN